MSEEINENIKIERKRWVYIPLGILIFMCLGTVYSWSVFRKPVEVYFNIGATLSGLPFMFFLFFYALVMPITGIFIDKYSPKLLTIIGGIFVASGWILSGITTNIWLLIITYGIIAGSGVGIVYGVPLAVTSKWFPDKNGFAAGLTLMGFGLSPFITAPLANFLLDKYGLLPTFQLLGIVFGVIIILLAIPLKFPQKKYQIQQNKSIKGKTNNISTGNMFKKPVFYGLWVCFIIGALIGLMAIAITSPVAVEVIGLNSRTAALLISLFAVFNGLGRPLFGWLTDKFQPRFAVLTSYILIIIASTIMLNSGPGNIILYTVAFVFFWMNLGGWLAIAPAATDFYFGSENYSKNYGFVFTAYGVGAILGTLISGRLRDLFGSYIYSFYPILFLSLTGIILAFLLLKKKNLNKS